MSAVDLDQALGELAAEVSFPPTPDFVGRVVDQVEEMGRPPGRRPFPRRLLLGAVAAVVAALVGLIGLSPRARAIANDLIHLRGIRIEHVRRLPPAGSALHLGRKVDRAEAERLARLSLSGPALLGTPDGFYVASGPGGMVASAVYQARPALPVTTGSDVGLVLTEFRANGTDPALIKKLFADGTPIDDVTVRGASGYWIAAPHVVLFMGPNGQVDADPPRLSGPTLLWEREGVTYRLESALSEVEALRLARSIP
jgi:hypothetical protein